MTIIIRARTCSAEWVVLILFILEPRYVEAGDYARIFQSETVMISLI
jgi:hypothetical protein